MSQGLQTFGANTVIQFDSTWRQWRFVESLVLAAGSSGSKSYDGVDDIYDLAAVSIPQNFASAGHTITISGKTITWTYFSYSSWITYSATQTFLEVFSR